MPPTPPTDYQTLSQAQLNDKFAQENWADRLDAWVQEIEVTNWDTRVTGGRRLSERKAKYRDGNGNTRACIIDYTHDDGSG